MDCISIKFVTWMLTSVTTDPYPSTFWHIVIIIQFQMVICVSRRYWTTHRRGNLPLQLPGRFAINFIFFSFFFSFFPPSPFFIRWALFSFDIFLKVQTPPGWKFSCVLKKVFIIITPASGIYYAKKKMYPRKLWRYSLLENNTSNCVNKH